VHPQQPRVFASVPKRQQPRVFASVPKRQQPRVSASAPRRPPPGATRLSARPRVPVQDSRRGYQYRCPRRRYPPHRPTPHRPTPPPLQGRRHPHRARSRERSGGTCPSPDAGFASASPPLSRNPTVRYGIDPSAWPPSEDRTLVHSRLEISPLMSVTPACRGELAQITVRICGASTNSPSGTRGASITLQRVAKGMSA